MLKDGNDSKIGLPKKVHGRKVAFKTLGDTCLEKIVEKDQVVISPIATVLKMLTPSKMAL